MKIIVQFSGGKDSLACLLWAINTYKKENIIAIFCDTGIESPKTYQHIKEVIDRLQVEFIVLKGEKNFYELAEYKKRFPSTKARFCTEFLKIRPFINFILNYKQHTIIIQGIRAEESKSRAKMQAECTYFKYYFQPYTNNSMKVTDLLEIKKIKPLTIIQDKLLKALEARLVLGKEDCKFHTYRKKEIIEFCKEYATDIQRPFFTQTANEVMKYILDNGFKPNPLYYEGFKRVGCFPCIMANQSEIKLIANNYPDKIKEIEIEENKNGHTYFAPTYIPKRFCSNKNYPTIQDVVNYVQRENTNIFKTEENIKSCMSIYNICE